LQELVFSDEFEGYSSTAALGSPSDIRWTSMDYHYSSDKNEWQNYKPEQVTVSNGQLLLTMEDKNSTGWCVMGGLGRVSGGVSDGTTTAPTTTNGRTTNQNRSKCRMELCC
jgi:hypothetical protein